MKYLAEGYDNKRKFINGINEDTYKDSKNLIKDNIFKLKYNKKDNYSDIVLIDTDRSGFMDDIDILVKLNKMLDEYIRTYLLQELSNVDNPNDKKKILRKNNH